MDNKVDSARDDSRIRTSYRNTAIMLVMVVIISTLLALIFRQYILANYALTTFLTAVLLLAAGLLVVFYYYSREQRRGRRELAKLLEKRSCELSESEERYRRLLNNAEDAIYTVDLDFILLDANRHTFERLGYNRQEAIGQNISMFLPPGSEAKMISWREKVLQNKILRYEDLQRRRDGSLLPVEVFSQLVEEQDRLSILSIARDISRRKRAEEALQASERRHRIIFENSPVGIAYFDSHGRVLSANQQLAVIIGTEVENITGINIAQNLEERGFEEAFKKAAGGIFSSCEGERINSATGQRQFFKVIFSPVSAQKPSDVIGLVEDVTELRYDAEKLRQLYTAIEQTPMVVVITDRQARIQFANQAFEQVTGYSLEEVMGQNPRILNARTQPREYYEEMWNTILAGQVWRGEFHNRKKNRSLYWERVAIAPVHDEKGEISHFVAVKEEITERKLMTQVDSFIARLEEQGFVCTMEEIRQQCLEDAMKLLDSPVGFLVFNYKEYRYFISSLGPGLPESECRLDKEKLYQMLLGDTIWGRSIREQKALLSNDPGETAARAIPEGHIVLNSIMAIPVIDNGEVLGLLGLGNKEGGYCQMDRDIANMYARNAWSTLRRQQAEKSLRESEERTRKIFDASQAGIILIDAENRKIVDANPSALEMYGGSMDQLLDRHCHDTMCMASDCTCPVIDLGKAVQTSEHVLIRADGSHLPILKSVSLILIGGKQYLLESFLDLSERKTIEAELQKAKETAEAANRTKSAFLANMSHEIRTPMNAILGYAQLLKHDPALNPEHQRNLDIINRSGNHLLRLIDDILEMSKIEAGRSSLHEVNCDFKALLIDLENMFRLRADEKGLRLLVEMVNDLPRYISVDEGKLRQVLVNLLGNAMKFTDEGGIVVRIARVDAENNRDDEGGLNYDRQLVQIVVEVEDSGCGIAETETGKIFGAFVQAESGLNQSSGTGLGLTISRDYARLLGGDLLLARSLPGSGSLFRFTFNCRVIEEALFSSGGARETKVLAIAGQEREWKVLVVDDRDSNRDFLRQMLTRVGFSVQEAVDGEDGVAKFESWHPDIILMDMMMPNMNGYEAIKEIRSRSGNDSVVIIAISASVMDGNGQRALEAGADDFLRKPFRESELFESIRQFCDIKYINEMEEEPLNRNIKEGAVKTRLSRYDLNSVPVPLLAAMQDAVENGDMIRLNSLIDELEVGMGNDSFAGYLRGLADKYDYPAIINLLEQVGSPD